MTDLHSVTPSCFLEVAAGSVHALSYQQARNNSAALGQVYVAEPGYMLVGWGRGGMEPCTGCFSTFFSVYRCVWEAGAGVCCGTRLHAGVLE